jgi:hypothetical protein
MIPLDGKETTLMNTKDFLHDATAPVEQSAHAMFEGAVFQFEDIEVDSHNLVV